MSYFDLTFKLAERSGQAPSNFYYSVVCHTLYNYNIGA